MFGQYTVVFRAYSWDYSQESLLAELRGPYVVPKIEPRLAANKVNTQSNVLCELFVNMSTLFNNSVFHFLIRKSRHELGAHLGGLCYKLHEVLKAVLGTS